MKKLLLLSLLVSNISLAKTEMSKSSIDLKMKSFDEIKTKNKDHYLSLKFALIANIVEKVDFSVLDLESPYSYRSREITLEEHPISKKFECEVEYEHEEYTMRKNAKIIKIYKGTGFEYSEKNPVGCPVDISKSAYTDYVDVVTYQAPSTKEFKDSLVETLQNHKYKNAPDNLNEERIFKLEGNGFTIWKKGEKIFSLHAGMAINGDLIFEEEIEAAKTVLNDYTLPMANDKVTGLTQINSVYIGGYSYLKRFSPKAEQKVELYNEINTAPTVSELIKNL